MILESLKRLEYRGYDSAGIAMAIPGAGVEVRKAQGKLSALADLLPGFPAGLTVGIGHTRWATHGRPTDLNAHPQVDCSGTLAAVHNGIIENWREVREELEAAGHRFRSETDTEVLLHLVEAYGGTRDLLPAVTRAVGRLTGAYAFLILSAAEPEHLIAVRRASPLVIGVGEHENYLGSDVSAFLPYTRRALVLNDGELAVVGKEDIALYRLEEERLVPLHREPFQVTWTVQQAERGGYPHFMLKEIMEQPEVWGDCLLGRTAAGAVRWEELGLDPAEAAGWPRIQMVAAGTAYHAGLLGRAWMEGLARVPVDVDLSSEFRYRQPLLQPGTPVWAISQSGETADTLASLRLARELGAPTYAVVNVVGSTIAREADRVAYTRAGPEIAVASTKAYTTQLLTLLLAALGLAASRGRPRPDLVEELAALPRLGREFLPRASEWARARAGELAAARDVFFIGRGLDYALAMEGQLKLKEISYLHAEAYAAGELKHGTLALIEEGVPVIALATQPELVEKTASNIEEVQARGAQVWVIAGAGLAPHLPAAEVLSLPALPPLLAPFLAAPVLQLLAYWTAVVRGENVDQPRNLAKSVTVE
ncbi:MAG: glutamine--fructose-6-phosphate transaminase (isomerizing) [Firmicutes bacterium]|nr:glutamine--fructose-6-phosphate transaminase (isomerizing) [Bacillota bacterium]